MPDEEQKETVTTQEESVASIQEPVNQTAEETPVEETAPQEQPEQKQEIPPSYEAVDERGVPWKNRAMEMERKFQNEIPQVIRQTVEEITKGQQKQPEYTVEDLERYGIENPQHRPWVESQKAQLIQKNLEKSIETKLQAKDQQFRESQIRQESENWVTSHPKFKDCFISDANGRKVWNMSNPLTHVIGNYLNQADPVSGKLLRDRSDGIAVAARLAFADHALNSEPKAATQVNQLKKDLKKAQKVQMIPGSGTVSSAAPKTDVRKSLENYTKTYAKSDIQRATKSFLLASGLIKEE